MAIGVPNTKLKICFPFFSSRFDWEDKLLEKTIKIDIKLEQHMTKLEDTVRDIKAHKDVFEEWRQKATAEYEKLEEWKREWDESKANHIMVQASKLQRTTYTRWGRTTCPENGSESVYDGFAGGSHYSHSGGASSMLCLPKDPDWDAGKTSDNENPNVGLIYGVEYEDGSSRNDQLFGESHQNRDVPCVVCEAVQRSTVLMIPGKTKCHPGWTLEYTGYLMSGYYGHSATDYYCVDKDPENLPHGTADNNGYLLYFVEARCGSLRCPPYINGREFLCAVCTK